MYIVDECGRPDCAEMSPPMARKLPKASLVVALGFASEQQDDSVEAGDQDSDEEGEDRWPEAEKGGDHGEEFYVAHAHAFAVAERFVEPADDQEDERGSDDGGDAAEDEALGAGEEDVAVIGDASGTCEVEAVFGEEDLVFGGAEEDGLRADEEEGDGDAGQGEGVGEGEGLPVDDHQADQEEAEDGDAEDISRL